MRQPEKIGGIRVYNKGHRTLATMSKAKKEEEKPKGKVLGYFCNGLGNLIEYTPALVALSDHFGGPIDICLSAEWNDSRKVQVLDILSKWDRINRVIEVFTPMGSDYLVTREGEKIHKKDYKLLFATGHNTNSAVMSWFGKYGNYWERARWRQTRMSEVEFHMNEVYRQTAYRGPIPPLQIPVAEMPDLGKRDAMRVVLCNGSARSDTFLWEKKRWWGFPVLADLLRRYYGAQIYFVGYGEDDLKDAMEVKAAVPQLNELVSRKLMITETAKVLSQCDLLVTTDTSVMHVGAAVGIPLVALFGPTLVSKNMPWTDRKVIFRSPVACAPCQYHFMFEMGTYLSIEKDQYAEKNKPYCLDKVKVNGKESQTYKCMAHIYPERVMKAIRDFWKG